MGVLFCDACRALVEPVFPPVCRLCGVPWADGLCPSCRQRSTALQGIAAAAYFSGPLREAIHSLKYRGNRSLAAPLSDYLLEAWRRTWPCLGSPPDLIVPVPLHRRRLADRGYNQSALLARSLGRSLGVPLAESVLVRDLNTPPQAGLDRAARQRNVSGAFACQGDVAGRCVVLVDDVCTTGATLEACAAALKAANAATVWALTLGRARWLTGQPAPDAGPGAGAWGPR
jgi:ComF family protein